MSVGIALRCDHAVSQLQVPELLVAPVNATVTGV